MGEDPKVGSIQASSVVLQDCLLQIRRDHAITAHVEWNLTGHQRLLAHKLVLLLLPKAHHVLFTGQISRGAHIHS